MKKKTRSLGRDLENEKLRSLPLKKPLFVTKDTAIYTVLDRMRDARIGCALVKDGERLVGIFTERDVLARVIEAKQDLKTPIEKVMTPTPKMLSMDDTIATAVRLLDEGGHRNVPITENGEVVRILTARTLVKYFGSNFPEEVYNLPPDPDQVQMEREGA